jgi:shikimate dehydrogenase
VTSSSLPPILALLAQPVSGNPTQYMIEKAFAHHDLDWRYLTFEVGAEDLGNAVRGLKALGFYGGHIGVPHKEAVIPLLDGVTDTAAALGEVNLFFQKDDALIGDNIEGKGLLQAVKLTTDPVGKRIVLLGAGKIAQAIALELAAAGAGEIIVLDPVESLAKDMVALVTAKNPIQVSAPPWQNDYALPEETKLLIHAVSGGGPNEHAPAPISYESLKPDLLVVDASSDAPQSPLLHEAAARECKTLDGLSIFIEQVALAIKIWTGVDPDRGVLRDAVEEYLEV